MPKYMVTISPPYRPVKPFTLYCDDTHDIRRYLNKFSHHYCLYPEFDDKSRLHYHGIAWIHDPIKLHKTKHLIDKSIGYSTFRLCKDFIEELRSLTYSMKNWPSNNTYFIQPIMYKRLKRKTISLPASDLDVGIYKYIL